MHICKKSSNFAGILYDFAPIMQSIIDIIGQISLGTADYCLIGVLAVLFVYQVYFYTRYIGAPQRYAKRQAPYTPIPAEQQKGVSVIVCAHNEEHNLQDYLQSLLTQDYSNYEVIVVNDGSEDHTREVIEEYMRYDHRIVTTFVPRGARVNSTKKLAITLAVKRAKYDYLLLTDADCRPESPHWITEMMRGFDDPQKEIVIGFGAYYPDHTRINRIIQYDTLFCGLQYLGMALARHPYMGVGRNLAYKKDLFLRTGGFSTMMNQRAGDDDLLVNHVATKTNTAVVVSRESITWSPAKETLHDWLLQKRRHIGVSHDYTSNSKTRLGIEPVTRGLFYLMLIAAGVLGNMAVWATAGLLFIARLIMQLTIINLSAKQLGVRGFGLVILWYDICLPLVTLNMLTKKPLKAGQW